MLFVTMENLAENTYKVTTKLNIQIAFAKVTIQNFYLNKEA